MEKTNCDLCGKGQTTLLFKNRDRVYNLPGKFELVKCSNCDLVSIQPAPSKGKLSDHYPKKEYYSLNKNEIETTKLKLYELFYNKGNLVKKLIFAPLKFIVRGIVIKKNTNILDIGCGDGKFLRLMQKFGMNCYGVEPNLGKAINTKKLKISNSELKHSKFKPHFFDIITLNHVLEHVNSPSKTLKEIHRILKPNGTLIVATPNIGSIAAKFFGNKWFQLDTPRHLFLFSEKTIRNYAEKEGFQIKKVRYNSSPLQFSTSFSYLFTDLFSFDEEIPNLNKMFFILFLPLAHLVNFFRLGDQFEIVLTKADFTTGEKK